MIRGMVQAPPRPQEWRERAGLRLVRALAPQLRVVPPAAAPPVLLPYENLSVERDRGPGTLAATWYPAYVSPRGAVLLLHPWIPEGRAYFHRLGRIEALRAAGYHALTIDLPGFGGSGRPSGLYDRAVEDALARLDRLGKGLDLFIWGVGVGGYWSHQVLARTDQVAGAMFEDVPSHLYEWSSRVEPWGKPARILVQRMLPDVHRYLDLRRHATAFDLGAVTYISGARNLGVRPEETRTLAECAGGSYSIVRGAGHLGSIEVANRAVIRTALETFERAAEHSTTAVQFEPGDDSQVSAVG